MSDEKEEKDWGKHTVVLLRKELMKRGLATSGRKNDLVKRLEDYDKGVQPEQGTSSAVVEDESGSVVELHEDTDDVVPGDTEFPVVTDTDRLEPSTDENSGEEETEAVEEFGKSSGNEPGVCSSADVCVEKSSENESCVQSRADVCPEKAPENESGVQSSADACPEIASENESGVQSSADACDEEASVGNESDVQSSVDVRTEKASNNETGVQSSVDICPEKSSENESGVQSSADACDEEASVENESDVQSSVDVRTEKASNNETGVQSSVDICPEKSSENESGVQSSADACDEEASVENESDVQSSVDVRTEKASNNETGVQSSVDICPEKSSENESGVQSSADACDEEASLGNETRQRFSSSKSYFDDITSDNSSEEEEVKCSKCNKLGHKDDQCPRPRWKCYLCKEYGHASVRCPTKQQGVKVRLPTSSTDDIAGQTHTETENSVQETTEQTLLDDKPVSQDEPKSVESLQTNAVVLQESDNVEVVMEESEKLEEVSDTFKSSSVDEPSDTDFVVLEDTEAKNTMVDVSIPEEKQSTSVEKSMEEGNKLETEDNFPKKDDLGEVEMHDVPIQEQNQSTSVETSLEDSTKPENEDNSPEKNDFADVQTNDIQTQEENQSTSVEKSLEESTKPENADNSPKKDDLADLKTHDIQTQEENQSKFVETSLEDSTKPENEDNSPEKNDFADVQTHDIPTQEEKQSTSVEKSLDESTKPENEDNLPKKDDSSSVAEDAIENKKVEMETVEKMDTEAAEESDKNAEQTKVEASSDDVDDCMIVDEAVEPVTILSDEEEQEEQSEEDEDDFVNFDGFVVIDEAEDSSSDRDTPTPPIVQEKQDSPEKADKVVPAKKDVEYSDLIKTGKKIVVEVEDKSPDETAKPEVVTSVPALRNLCDSLGLVTGAAVSVVTRTEPAPFVEEIPVVADMATAITDEAAASPYVWSPALACSICNLPGHHLIHCTRKQWFCNACSRIGHLQHACPGITYHGWCVRCSLFGHQGAECPRTFSQCNNCWQYGHTIEECTNPAGSPEWCPPCSMYGHSPPSCPRSYYTCSRCSKIGHFGEECTEPPVSAAIHLPIYKAICTTCNTVDHSATCPKRYLQCLKCGERGHLKIECTAKPGKCPRCDKEGHFMSDCPSGKEIDSKSLKSIPKPIPKPIEKADEIPKELEEEIEKLDKDYFGGWVVQVQKPPYYNNELAAGHFSKIDSVQNVRIYDGAKKMFVSMMTNEGAKAVLKDMWGSNFDPKAATVNTNYKETRIGLTVEEVEIIQTEKRRRTSSESREDTSSKTEQLSESDDIGKEEKAPGSSIEKCPKCTKLHAGSECPQSVWKCFICKEEGHASVKCPKKSEKEKQPAPITPMELELEKIRKDYYGGWNLFVTMCHLRNHEIACNFFKAYDKVQEVRMYPYADKVFVAFMSKDGARRAMRHIWDTRFNPKVATVNKDYVKTGKIALTFEELLIVQRHLETEREANAWKEKEKEAAATEAKAEAQTEEELIQEQLKKLKPDHFQCWNIYIKRIGIRTEEVAKTIYKRFGYVSEVRLYENLVFITYMTQEGATKALRSLWNTKYDPKIPTVNPNYKVNVPSVLTLEEAGLFRVTHPIKKTAVATPHPPASLSSNLEGNREVPTVTASKTEVDVPLSSKAKITVELTPPVQAKYQGNVISLTEASNPVLGLVKTRTDFPMPAVVADNERSMYDEFQKIKKDQSQGWNIWVKTNTYWNKEKAIERFRAYGFVEDARIYGAAKMMFITFKTKKQAESALRCLFDSDFKPRGATITSSALYSVTTARTLEEYHLQNGTSPYLKMKLNADVAEAEITDEDMAEQVLQDFLNDLDESGSESEQEMEEEEKEKGSIEGQDNDSIEDGTHQESSEEKKKQSMEEQETNIEEKESKEQQGKDGNGSQEKESTEEQEKKIQPEGIRDVEGQEKVGIAEKEKGTVQESLEKNEQEISEEKAAKNVDLEHMVIAKALEDMAKENELGEVNHDSVIEQSKKQLENILKHDEILKGGNSGVDDSTVSQGNTSVTSEDKEKDGIFANVNSEKHKEAGLSEQSETVTSSADQDQMQTDCSIEPKQTFDESTTASAINQDNQSSAVTFNDKVQDMDTSNSLQPVEKVPVDSDNKNVVDNLSSGDDVKESEEKTVSGTAEQNQSDSSVILGKTEAVEANMYSEVQDKNTDASATDTLVESMNSNQDKNTDASATDTLVDSINSNQDNNTDASATDTLVDSKNSNVDTVTQSEKPSDESEKNDALEVGSVIEATEKIVDLKHTVAVDSSVELVEEVKSTEPISDSGIESKLTGIATSGKEWEQTQDTQESVLETRDKTSLYKTDVPSDSVVHVESVSSDPAVKVRSISTSSEGKRSNEGFQDSEEVDITGDCHQQMSSASSCEEKNVELDQDGEKRKTENKEIENQPLVESLSNKEMGNLKGDNESTETILNLSDPDIERKLDDSIVSNLSDSKERELDLLESVFSNSNVMESSSSLIKENYIGDSLCKESNEVKDESGGKEVATENISRSEEKHLEKSENIKRDQDLVDEQTFEGDKDESLQGEGVKDESLQGEGVKDESLQGEGVKDESIQSEVVKEESLQGEGLKEEGLQGEGVKDESLLGEGVKDESLQGEGVKDESLQSEVVKEESIDGEGLKEESLQVEGVKDESLQGEGVKDESLQSEVVKEESLQVEGVKDESLQGEGVKDESLQSEVVKEESLQDEGVKDEIIIHEVVHDKIVEGHEDEVVLLETDQVESMKVQGQNISQAKSVDTIGEVKVETPVNNDMLIEEGKRNKIIVQTSECKTGDENNIRSAGKRKRTNSEEMDTGGKKITLSPQDVRVKECYVKLVKVGESLSKKFKDGESSSKVMSKEGVDHLVTDSAMEIQNQQSQNVIDSKEITKPDESERKIEHTNDDDKKETPVSNDGQMEVSDPSVNAPSDSNKEAKLKDDSASTKDVPTEKKVKPMSKKQLRAKLIEELKKSTTELIQKSKNLPKQQQKELIDKLKKEATEVIKLSKSNPEMDSQVLLNKLGVSTAELIQNAKKATSELLRTAIIQELKKSTVELIKKTKKLPQTEQKQLIDKLKKDATEVIKLSKATPDIVQDELIKKMRSTSEELFKEVNELIRQKKVDDLIRQKKAKPKKEKKEEKAEKPKVVGTMAFIQRLKSDSKMARPDESEMDTNLTSEEGLVKTTPEQKSVIEEPPIVNPHKIVYQIGTRVKTKDTGSVVDDSAAMPPPLGLPFTVSQSLPVVPVQTLPTAPQIIQPIQPVVDASVQPVPALKFNEFQCIQSIKPRPLDLVQPIPVQQRPAYPVPVQPVVTNSGPGVFAVPMPVLPIKPVSTIQVQPVPAEKKEEPDPLHPNYFTEWMDKQMTEKVTKLRLFITELQPQDVSNGLLTEWAAKSVYFAINRTLQEKRASAFFQLKVEKQAVEAEEAFTKAFSEGVKITHPSKGHQFKKVYDTVSLRLEEPAFGTSSVVIEGIPEETTEEQVLEVVPNSIMACKIEIKTKEIEWADEKFFLPEEALKNLWFVQCTSRDYADDVAEKSHLDLNETTKIYPLSFSDFKLDYREEFWDLCIARYNVKVKDLPTGLVFSDHKRLDHCDDLRQHYTRAKTDMRKNALKRLDSRILNKISMFKEDLNMDASRRARNGLSFPEQPRYMTTHAKKLQRMMKLKQTEALYAIVGEPSIHEIEETKKEQERAKEKEKEKFGSKEKEDRKSSTKDTNEESNKDKKQQMKSPDRSRKSPDRSRKSPDRLRKSPDRSRKSPDRSRKSPERSRKSPERSKKSLERSPSEKEKDDKEGSKRRRSRSRSPEKDRSRDRSPEKSSRSERDKKDRKEFSSRDSHSKGFDARSVIESNRHDGVGRFIPAPLPLRKRERSPDKYVKSLSLKDDRESEGDHGDRKRSKKSDEHKQETGCSICGYGNHTADKCKRKNVTVVCHNCEKIGHMSPACRLGANFCLKCKKSGHLDKYCTAKGGVAALPGKICFNCGLPGHVISDCSKKKHKRREEIRESLVKAVPDMNGWFGIIVTTDINFFKHTCDFPSNIVDFYMDGHMTAMAMLSEWSANKKLRYRYQECKKKKIGDSSYGYEYVVGDQVYQHAGGETREEAKENAARNVILAALGFDTISKASKLSQYGIIQKISWNHLQRQLLVYYATKQEAENLMVDIPTAVLYVPMVERPTLKSKWDEARSSPLRLEQKQSSKPSIKSWLSEPLSGSKEADWNDPSPVFKSRDDKLSPGHHSKSKRGQEGSSSMQESSSSSSMPQRRFTEDPPELNIRRDTSKTKKIEKKSPTERLNLEKLALTLDSLEADNSGWVTVCIFNENKLLANNQIKKMFSKYGEITRIYNRKEESYISFSSKGAAMKAVQDFWGTKYNIEAKMVPSRFNKVKEHVFPIVNPLDDNEEFQATLANLKEQKQGGFVVGFKKVAGKSYTPKMVKVIFGKFGSISSVTFDNDEVQIKYDKRQSAVDALKENWEKLEMFAVKDVTIKCYYCGTNKHTAKDCKRKSGYCNTCKQFGHKTEDCPNVLCTVCFKTGCKIHGPPTSAKSVENCAHCGSTNHATNDCSTKSEYCHACKNYGHPTSRCPTLPCAVCGVSGCKDRLHREMNDKIYQGKESGLSVKIQNPQGGVKEKPDKGALGGLISTYKSDESEDDIRDYSSLESDVEENRSKDNPKLTAELRKLRKTKLGHWIVCIAPDAMYNIQKVDVLQKFVKFGKIKDAEFRDGKFYVSFKTGSRARNAVRDMWGTMWRISVPELKKNAASGSSSGEEDYSMSYEKKKYNPRGKKEEKASKIKTKRTSLEKRGQEKYKVPSGYDSDDRSRSQSREREYRRDSRHADEDKHRRKEQRSKPAKESDDEEDEDESFKRELKNMHEDYQGCWNISVLNHGSLRKTEVEAMFAQYGTIRSINITEKRVYIGYDSYKAAKIATASLFGSKWEGKVPSKQELEYLLQSKAAPLDDRHRSQEKDPYKRSDAASPDRYNQPHYSRDREDTTKYRSQRSSSPDKGSWYRGAEGASNVRSRRSDEYEGSTRPGSSESPGYLSSSRDIDHRRPGFAQDDNEDRSRSGSRSLYDEERAHRGMSMEKRKAESQLVEGLDEKRAKVEGSSETPKSMVATVLQGLKDVLSSKVNELVRLGGEGETTGHVMQGLIHSLDQIKDKDGRPQRPGESHNVQPPNPQQYDPLSRSVPQHQPQPQAPPVHNLPPNTSIMPAQPGLPSRSHYTGVGGSSIQGGPPSAVQQQLPNVQQNPQRLAYQYVQPQQHQQQQQQQQQQQHQQMTNIPGASGAAAAMAYQQQQQQQRVAAGAPMGYSAPRQQVPQQQPAVAPANLPPGWQYYQQLAVGRGMPSTNVQHSQQHPLPRQPGMYYPGR